MKVRPWTILLALGMVALLMASAACGDDDDSGATETPGTPGTATSIDTPGTTTSMDFFFGATNAPAFLVADGEGFFAEEGIDANISVTDEDIGPFFAGQAEVALISPWEVGGFINEGEEIAVFGTAGTSTYFNGIAVKAENFPDPYGSIEDLVGTKLGIPGFGTGTWAAFEGFVQSQFGLDATTDFEVVEASPGALLGLLETGEIQGALLFSGQTLTAIGSGDFELVFRFDQEWNQVTGQPVSISTLVARTSWLDENPDVAQSVVTALDKAVEWMVANTTEFAEGGKYESIAQDAGWLNDDTTNLAVQAFISAETYYTRESLYTDAYIDSSYEFVLVVLPDAPPQDVIFYRLD